MADLKAQSIKDYGKISRHGWVLEPPGRIAPVGLVIGGERMELSRWPNKNEKTEYLDEMSAKEGLLGMVSFTEIIGTVFLKVLLCEEVPDKPDYDSH